MLTSASSLDASKLQGTATISTTGNAATATTATAATNDGDGNAIASTYLKKSGGTMSGNLTVSGDLEVTWNLTNNGQAVLTEAGGYLENGFLTGFDKVYAMGSVSGAVTIYFSRGAVQTMTVAWQITSMSVTPSMDSSNRVMMLSLVITNGAAYSIAWPSGIKWPDGEQPSLQSSGVDIVLLVNVSGQWYGMLSGGAMAAES